MGHRTGFAALIKHKPVFRLSRMLGKGHTLPSKFCGVLRAIVLSRPHKWPAERSHIKKRQRSSNSIKSQDNF